MNNLDIEIYKQIKPTKGLTEIYLGHVIFPWHYALADYSVDRTEGIPFDVFDKVICRRNHDHSPVGQYPWHEY